MNSRRVRISRSPSEGEKPRDISRACRTRPSPRVCWRSVRRPTRTSSHPAMALVASDTPSASSSKLVSDPSRPAALSSRGRRGDFRQFARSPTASRRAGRRIERQPLPQLVPDPALRSPAPVDGELVVAFLLRPIGEVGKRLEDVGEPGDHRIGLDQVLSQQSQVVVVVLEVGELDGHFDPVVRRERGEAARPKSLPSAGSDPNPAGTGRGSVARRTAGSTCRSCSRRR